MDTTRPILLIPGLGNSGPGHWQTAWERIYSSARRVDLGDWDAPRRDRWVERLDAAIADCAAPPVLVAHSLGVIAVAHWRTRSTAPVHAALLVAPPDVTRPDMPDAVSAFGEPPRAPLGFPAVVAASADDPYCTLDEARALAHAWHADFVDLGPAGHVNTASGHGPWPEGEALLRRLLG